MHVSLYKSLRYVAAILLGIAVLSSCSPRKNTAANRRYQAFITKYNIYFNGDEHYRNTLGEMESRYEDDFSKLLLMHPAEAKGMEGVPQPSGNFDRSIQKGQKAIQVRSIRTKPDRKGSSTPQQKEWLKREEYNPFLHNAWLMMGRGQYFNGDFLGAASTFFYISRHFPWLPATVTEAELWQARSYVSLDWLFEAEVILNRIKPESLTTPALRGLYDFVKADLLIRSGKYDEAVKPLVGAIGQADGAQKNRLYFLLGQLYARLGRNADAYAAFGKVSGSASASYRTKFNARIKQSEVFEGSDIAPEVKALKRMASLERNSEYLDQIYYAIGNLYLSHRDTTQAIENYKLAASKSKRNGIDKALAQLTLGKLYFDLTRYDKAQPCYSEAVPVLGAKFPGYDSIKQRSDVLDELAVYSQNVTTQDSLLRLAAMPEEERLKVIDKIIEDLVKREKAEADSLQRAKFMAENEGKEELNDKNAPSFNINTDNSWYFYNSATRNAGKTEFQRRWGSRKLEDNWRRRNKTEFNTGDWNQSGSENESAQSDSVASDTTVTKNEESAKNSDPHTREYYIAQLPLTDEQKANSGQIIQDGLYNMGIILKDKLEDFGAARNMFDRLLADYPDNTFRLDVYYNLYLMYARVGMNDVAEQFRKLILSDFAQSPYGQALADPHFLENLKTMDARQEQLYESAYTAFVNNHNDSVHAAAVTMHEKFPLSKIMPKFMFLDALAYVAERQNDKFNEVLRQLLERYPDTNITPIASAWLKGMGQGRQISENTGGANMRGMIWDMRLTNDSSAVANTQAASFAINPDDRLLLIFTFDTREVSVNELLYEVARHNFKSFAVKTYELEPMNYGPLGMIVVSSFGNNREAEHYRRVMSESTDFRLPAGVRPIVISENNFKLLMNEGRSFDEYFKFLQEKNIESAHSWAGPAPVAPEQTPMQTQSQEQAQPQTAPIQPEISPENNTQPLQPAAPVILPIPAAQPATTLPQYAPGSEGDDDPLLN